MQKLFITDYRNKRIGCLFEDGKLIEIWTYDANNNTKLGNIYIGRVQNIIQNINAAFVEIQRGEPCYLNLTKVREPIFRSGIEKTKISVGDELLVQVCKEDLKSKAPVVTEEFELVGKYLILKHNAKNGAVSQKITDAKERKRLLDIISQVVTENFNFIIRTNAENTPEDILLTEAKKLINRYQSLITKEIYRPAYTLLEQNIPAYLQPLRDCNQSFLQEIITDCRDVYDEIKSTLSSDDNKELPLLTFYNDNEVMMHTRYGLHAALKEAFQPMIWLKSGANIVIEQTEALTAIDVNTGKAIKGKSKTEETFLKINLEAATEIARQLRLRNLSGIIIVDFIDMKEPESDVRLISHLKELLRKDSVKSEFIDITKLHLIELTRKKVKKSLREQFEVDNF